MADRRLSPTPAQADACSAVAKADVHIVSLRGQFAQKRKKNESRFFLVHFMNPCTCIQGAYRWRSPNESRIQGIQGVGNEYIIRDCPRRVVSQTGGRHLRGYKLKRICLSWCWCRVSPTPAQADACSAVAQADGLRVRVTPIIYCAIV